MAKTKLKNLEVNEVSLVDAGANQHAHVKLYKRRDGKAPADDKQPQEQPAKSGLRKLFSAIGKALNVSQEDIDSAMSDIEKADTFAEKMEERKLRRISDEIWDVCFAPESSPSSIIHDDDVVDRVGMMNQSVDEFTETIKTLITSWGNGKSAQIAKAAEGITMEHMQEAYTRLGEAIAKTEPETNKVDPAGDDDDDQQDTPPAGEGETEKNCQTKKSKGGIPDMKFREDMMTPADKLAFEHLKKNYGIADGTNEGAGAGAEGAETIDKGMSTQPGTEGAGATQSGIEGAGEDIYKGLHPAVAAELQMLRKRADAAEERELLEVAKKYEIIGKKPEELVQTFKSLKAAGGTAYDDMIGVLDSAVAMTEKSGVFSEIGKRGNGTGNNGADAWAKIEKCAADIRKTAPELSQAEAIDRACMQRPELVSEYEANR